MRSVNDGIGVRQEIRRRAQEFFPKYRHYTGILMPIKSQKFKPIYTEDDTPVWWCFNCGANSAEGGKFVTEHYPAGDCDISCIFCGSSNTGEYGDGYRSEPCPLCKDKDMADEDCTICEGYAVVYPFQFKDSPESLKTNSDD